jgi:hypothetical protein
MESHRHGRRPTRHLGVVAATVAIFLGSGLGTAQASVGPSASIEGVWSFNGGKVAIQPLPGGSFVGTVVAATRFALCSHPVGEQMWTSIRPQADGSFWGLHQWYFEAEPCAPNPMLGPTAWRVLEAGKGQHFLLVCFSSPGSSQPTISPTGVRGNVSYGCFESALIAPLPPEPPATGRAAVKGFAQAVSLPSTRKCFSRRVFRIHLHDPLNDPLKEVVVRVAGRRVAIMRHGRTFAATIDLKGLPKGSFTVKIRLTTVLGHHLAGKRTYHTCVPKATKKKTRSHG